VRATHFPGLPITALTATAPERVVADVLAHLGIPAARRFTASAFRANLTLRVVRKPAGRDPDTGEDAALASLAAFVNAPGRAGACGIVYALSRDETEAVADGLNAMGVSAAHSHAGMNPDRRAQVQAGWQAGRVRVVVATIAFGMGIDKVREGEPRLFERERARCVGRGRWGDESTPTSRLPSHTRFTHIACITTQQQPRLNTEQPQHSRTCASSPTLSPPNAWPAISRRPAARAGMACPQSAWSGTPAGMSAA
jgi:hypothetical protein